MRYGSVCSGIEAASVAWKPLGWQAAFLSEIEKFPSAVLAHHYPDVPNLGDITKFKEWPDLGTIDLICGGTPCQSFSIAGLRKGLADPRGNLSLTFLAIVDRYRPRYVVWENVPGVLSSDGGRDFAAFLGGLGQLGYGWAFRVLDAQHVRVDGFPRAVPQRRRRVFVVGYLGDWRRAAAVLSEPESVLGNSPPRRQTGQRVAGTLTSSLGRRGGQPNDDNPADYLAFGGGNRSGPIEVAASLAAHGVRQDFEVETFIAQVASTLPSGGNSTGGDRQPGTSAETAGTMLVAHALRGDGFDASEDGTGRGTPLVPVWSVTQDSTPVSGEKFSPSLKIGTGLDMGQPPCVAYAVQERAISDNPAAGPDGVGVRQDGAAYTLEARQIPQAVAFAQNSRDEVRLQDGDGGIVGALAAEPGMKQTTYVQQGWAVRRLTPTECERLQGFPDGYTNIPWRGQPDGPRYKALGNSMAVNVMRWIGRRIEMVERLSEAEAA